MLKKGGLGHAVLKAAVQGIAPIIGGCVAAVASPFGGVVAERAINYFGHRIVDGWLVYSRQGTRPQWEAAIVDTATMPHDEARGLVTEEVERHAPGASPEDKALAINYLMAIPATMRRSLLSDPATGATSVPRNLRIDSAQGLLQMLPIDPPPFAAPCMLGGTTFRLENLIAPADLARCIKPRLPSSKTFPAQSSSV